MKPRILIVEESLTLRMDLEEAFAEAGFEPAACASAALAHQELAAQRYALFVVDMALPDGAAEELVRSLKSDPERAGLPVIALGREDELAAHPGGGSALAVDYVAKPYDRATLVRLARERVASTASGEALSPAPLVLVIDDSPTFREEMRELLETHGYRVSTANTGEEGLRLALQLRPNTVVIDGILPGIDGPTTIRRLRSEISVARTPCLLLTGSSQPADELIALDAGADSFLAKDMGKELILARVKAMLRDVSMPDDALWAAPRRILAVDDSPTFLAEVSAALEEEHFEVLQARTGEEALELLRVEPVDCVLLDLIMPGLSGEETCRLIKNRPEAKEVPVMILTARREQDVIVSCLNAGADDFVPKTGEFELLRARLRAQIRRKQFQEENRRIKETAATIRKNEMMLHALFEFAPDAVVVMDRHGVIVKANGQATRMFDYALAELVGQGIELLIPDGVRGSPPFQGSMAAGASTSGLGHGHGNGNIRRDLWAQRRDGERFAVDVSLGSLETDDGLWVLATVRDITDRKRAEALLLAKDEEMRETSRQLWQASKLATMGELSASIAHELNNPLATVSLRVESLMEKVPPGSPALAELQVIEQEVDRMAQLVANLLQFSRAEGSSMSTVDLRQEIESTLELVHHHLRKHKVTVACDFEGDLPCIQADRLKLRQLFLNLIVNASDAMPTGGTLTLHARETSFDGRPALQLDFRDTGVGIAPEHLARVVEPFFTTKPEGKGTGLGLAICRRIAQEHGGTLEIMSALGQGTTVRMLFPIQNGMNRDLLMDD